MRKLIEKYEGLNEAKEGSNIVSLNDMVWVLEDVWKKKGYQRTLLDSFRILDDVLKDRVIGALDYGKEAILSVSEARKLLKALKKAYKANKHKDVKEAISVLDYEIKNS
jgi:hypothetical protein